MFLIGLCVGSFLGVIIDRIPQNVSIIHGRSHCTSCNEFLALFDMIPLLSFIVLHGRCRRCNHPIPRFTFYVEGLTAGLFLFVRYTQPFTIDTLILLVFLSTLIIVSGIDWFTLIINNRFIVLIASLAIVRIVLGYIHLYSALIGSILIAFPLALIAKLTHGVGWGDVKLMAVCGLYLGPTTIAISFILSSLLGGLYALKMILCHQNTREPIPFAPLLCIGMILSIFCKDSILLLLLPQ
ncbi:prepilin peptidase [Erysipelothrix sp. HDW6C]|uniref:prepilin peptidase n=1 Tax=Erysipelothrix sp. HDW6C TaxID=2714930 RepID=UPI001409E4B2|nr:A24 family peptidase [Erysipelothrix sp. HDW6C]QIK69261.1 prepilin peptidase [Erysipelothrix sp. HDW6C]